MKQSLRSGLIAPQTSRGITEKAGMTVVESRAEGKQELRRRGAQGTGMMWG